MEAGDQSSDLINNYSTVRDNWLEEKGKEDESKAEHTHTSHRSKVGQKGTYARISHNWKGWNSYSHINHDNIAIQRGIYLHKTRNCSRPSSRQHIGFHSTAICGETPATDDISMACSGT